jgi:hypothetical protein
LQGHVIAVRRLFISERGIGMGASALRIHQGFARAACRGRRKEVMGQLGQVRL